MAAFYRAAQYRRQYLVPLFHAPFTQGVRRKTKLATERNETRPFQRVAQLVEAIPDAAVRVADLRGDYSIGEETQKTKEAREFKNLCIEPYQHPMAADREQRTPARSHKLLFLPRARFFPPRTDLGPLQAARQRRRERMKSTG